MSRTKRNSRPMELETLEQRLTPSTVDLTALSQLQQLVPDVPILVLGVDPAAARSKSAIAAGAAGYLSKGSPAREWREAVETVARGEIYPGV